MHIFFFAISRLCIKLKIKKSNLSSTDWKIAEWKVAVKKFIYNMLKSI